MTVRSIIAAVSLALLAVSADAADYTVGGGDTFPKEVKVGDVIAFARPAVGGRDRIDVTANGKPSSANWTGASRPTGSR
jgi:hypothetical protein